MPGFLCSVVVATYNRCHLLRRLFASLETQDIGLDSFEVIVVDDGSQDETAAFLATVKTPFALQVFHQENQGPAAARNLAVLHAKADLIVTLDDDVMPAANLLRSHLEAHSSGEPLAAMGVMVLPLDGRIAPWLEWEAISLAKQYRSMNNGEWNPSPRQFYTANASFRRGDAIAVGLFDVSFRRAEDVEFAYRLQDHGASFEFLPGAVVYHEPNRTLTEWLKIPFMYGHSDVVMWREKQRDNIGRYVRHDFHYRQRPVRIAARALVGRPWLLTAFTKGSTALAALSVRLGLRRAGFSLYSAIFNLQYWEGMSRSLGGKGYFWQHMQDETNRAPSAVAGGRG